MARALFRKAFIFVALAAVAAPAAAQFQSEGFEFLKAVKEEDGQKVTDALNEPGSTVVNTRDRTTGETALHIVTTARNPTWIRFLLQRGANPNTADLKGVTPLMLAAAYGDLDSVEALVKGGARLDVANDAGETPLMSAVHRRDLAMVKLLLEKGANPDKNDNSGRSARDYVALMNSNVPLLDLLAEHDRKKEEGAAAPKIYGPEIR